MTIQEFQRQITAGIPEELPAPKPYDPAINHAPRRKEILSPEERVLAVRNARDQHNHALPSCGS